MAGTPTNPSGSYGTPSPGQAGAQSPSPGPQKFCPQCGGGNAPNANVCQWCAWQFVTGMGATPPGSPYLQPYPQPGMPPHAPLARKSNGPIVFLLILVVACVFATVLLVLLGSLSSRNAAAPSVEPGTSQGASSGGAKIGDTVRVGSWDVTVERAEKVREIEWTGFGNTEEATGVFVKVYVTVENITNRTDSINSFDYRLVDSRGAEYKACADLACIAYPERESRDFFGKDVPPRSSGKLLALFDVATDAEGLQLVIESEARIDLGAIPGP